MQTVLVEAAFFHVICLGVFLVPLIGIGLILLALRVLRRRGQPVGDEVDAPTPTPISSTSWSRRITLSAVTLASFLLVILLYEVKPLWLAPPNRDFTILAYIPLRLVWLVPLYFALRAWSTRYRPAVAAAAYFAAFSLCHSRAGYAKLPIRKQGGNRSEAGR